MEKREKTIKNTENFGKRAKRNKPRRKIRPFRIIFLILLCVAFFFFGGKIIHIFEKSNVENSVENQKESIVDKLDKLTVAEGKNVDNEENVDKENSESYSNVKKTDWNLILVNPWNKLPSGYSVKRTMLKNGHSVDERAYPDLQKMMDDCRAAGLSPLICSSYRSIEKQQSLFDRKINQYISKGYSKSDAEKEAAKWVAIPGTSEHHTGLALDIVSVNYQVLDKHQENTEEQKWLMKNCYKYGFILRYAEDKSDITGITYEPWHYRYVGKEAAKEITDKGICLEEYLDSLK